LLAFLLKHIWIGID